MAKKDDFKSAYQRLHLHSKTAVKAVTQLPELELALMSCQLTFGGAPGPYKWSAISETVCDLTTAIDAVWNKSTWCVPQNKYLDDSIPFAEELERSLTLTHKAQPMTTSTTSFL